MIHNQGKPFDIWTDFKDIKRSKFKDLKQTKLTVRYPPKAIHSKNRIQHMNDRDARRKTLISIANNGMNGTYGVRKYSFVRFSGCRTINTVAEISKILNTNIMSNIHQLSKCKRNSAYNVMILSTQEHVMYINNPIAAVFHVDSVGSRTISDGKRSNPLTFPLDVLLTTLSSLV
jgi:hypothetical protein